MNVEIVWLAYDAKAVERAWSRVSIRELYMELLRDDFRKRVDPRSMLFHKNQFYLLHDLEVLMKCGGNDLCLEEYLARLFHKGIEEFPTESGELFLDYRLIAYYSSLKMSDEHHKAEAFFRSLLTKVGALSEAGHSNLLDMQSVGGANKFFEILGGVNFNTVVEVAEDFDNPRQFTKLLTNYIEFYNYARNNQLQPFYYNNQTDVRRWGDLIERKSRRDKRVVELTYGKSKDGHRLQTEGSAQGLLDDDLMSKMRFKRRIENLQIGLKDMDPLIRQKAAEGLGVSGNYISVLPLIEALEDEQPEVRQEVLRALGTIGDPRSVDAIIQLILKDESVAVIMSGAEALVSIGDPRGLEALIELLLRGVYDVAVQIAVFPELMKQKSAVNMLLQAMEHPNEVVRRQISFILGDIPTKVAVDTLVRSLDDEDNEVKTNSASSLGRIGSKRALPNLYQCRNQLESLHSRWVVEEAIDTILEKGRA